MFDHHRRRLIKFLDQLERGVGIHKIIEADLFAAFKLFGVCYAWLIAFFGQAIIGSFLMRILPVS